MLIIHNREKLINAAIYFAEKTRHCGKIKLIKLLYLLLNCRVIFCHMIVPLLSL